MPIELPHSGTRRASVTCDLMNSQRLRPGVLQRHRRAADRLEQPALRVHLDDNGIHFGQRSLVLVHDEVRTLRHDVRGRRR